MEHENMQLEETGRFDLRIPEPFDFVRTVAKPAGWHWSTPREVFLDGVLWTGIYIGDTPVGLKLSATKKTVHVTVFSGSALSPEETAELKSMIRDGLGADEDLPGFYRFARDDPVLSAVVSDLAGMRTGLLEDVFGGVILAILLQMAPMTRSEQMMAALLENFGTRIAFDGKDVILWPRPVDIVAVPAEELKSRAKLGYRAGRLVLAAQYLREHPMSLRELANLPEEEAFRQLTGIPGIGPYSAGIILGQTSLPIDTWSVVILSELFLGRTPEHPREEIDDVIVELTRRWGRWRWLAFVYVLNDLENLARKYRLSRLT
jgi:DNA-3-methyladenine glycosylase II